MTTSTSKAVSVIIPAFNRVATIRPAVESVLQQTFRDFEVIVVDDGSTDGTPEALAGIADPRLHVVVQPQNRGVSAARNTGIQAATGNWIAFQDSDDEWLPEKLGKQMARIAAMGPQCVGGYCGMTIIGSPSLTAGSTERYHPDPKVGVREGNILDTLLQESLISTQTLIARRDLLLQIGGFDEGLPALVDWDCVLRLARLGPFAFVDEPLVRQSFSENSITRSLPKRARARERVVEKNLDLLSGRPGLLAWHYAAIAGEKRRLKDIPGARAFLARARALRPFDTGLWARSTYLAGLQLLAAFRT